MSLTINGVLLNNSTHETHAVNVDITSSQLFNYKLKFYSDTKNAGNSQQRLRVMQTDFIGKIGAETSVEVINSFALFSRVRIRQANQPVPVLKARTNSQLFLKQCTIFENNMLQNKSAVITIHNSTAVLENCSISDNEGLYGGAVFVSDNSSLSVIQTVFNSNRASGSGGSLCSENSVEVLVINSMFVSNTAVLSGGAIKISTRTKLQIQQTTFRNNNVTTESGGSVALVYHCELFVSNSVFNKIQLGGEVELSLLTITMTFTLKVPSLQKCW